MFALKVKKITLAENGGLDVALEPEGVFGIVNAGACKLNIVEGPEILL